MAGTSPRRVSRAVWTKVALTAAGLASALLPAAATNAFHNRTPGTQGFVVTYFWHAMVPADAAACPDGFAIDAAKAHLDTLPPGREKQRLSKVENFRELFTRHASTGPKGENLCRLPWIVPDPGLRTVAGGGPAFGMDLDGGAPACAHQEFTGLDGAAGIDNQLYRVLGCMQGYQPNGAGEAYHMGAYRAGERTTLIEVTGLGDAPQKAWGNDRDIAVMLALSPDPPPIAASGAALPHASLRVTDKAAYRNRLRGRIENGVLTTEPQDIRLPMTSGHLVQTEYFIRSARLRLERQPDGGLKGMLAGYFDVARFYEQISMPTAKNEGAVKGGTVNFGYTCPGVWYALQRMADGHRDPASGRCTSISTAFRVEAVPAFVIHGEARLAGRAAAAEGK